MKKTVKIEGMSCGHCKAAVERALGALDEVKDVEVSLEDKQAVVEVSSEIDQKIKDAVEEEGYTVTEIK